MIQVAIAYVMQKAPYVFPIVGGRKIEHLLANIEALEITLSSDQVKYLESIEPFDRGFPHWMIVSYFLFLLFFQCIHFCVFLHRVMAKRNIVYSMVVPQLLEDRFLNLSALESNKVK
jgi:cytochrome c oxidase subunit IV